MIAPLELNVKNGLAYREEQHSKEFFLIEKKIDIHIRDRELDLLNGERIYFTIHDSENKYGSLEAIVKKYEEAGWTVNVKRSWGALFSDICLLISKPE